MKFKLDDFEMGTLHGFYKLAASRETDKEFRKSLAWIAEQFNPSRAYVELNQTRLKIILDLVDKIKLELSKVTSAPDEGAKVRLKVLSDTFQSVETKLRHGLKGEKDGD